MDVIKLKVFVISLNLYSSSSSCLISLLPSFGRGMRTEELQNKDLTAYTFPLIYFVYLNR
jgi:hypothetical protein